MRARATLPAIQQPCNRKLAVSPAVYQTSSLSCGPSTCTFAMAIHRHTHSRHSRKFGIQCGTCSAESRTPGTMRNGANIFAWFNSRPVNNPLVHHLYLEWNEWSLPLHTAPTTTTTTTIIFELICYAKISKCTTSLTPHLLHLCPMLTSHCAGEWNCGCGQFLSFLSGRIRRKNNNKIEWNSVKFPFVPLAGWRWRPMAWDEEMSSMKTIFFMFQLNDIDASVVHCVAEPGHECN